MECLSLVFTQTHQPLGHFPFAVIFLILFFCAKESEGTRVGWGGVCWGADKSRGGTAWHTDLMEGHQRKACGIRCRYLRPRLCPGNRKWKVGGEGVGGVGGGIRTWTSKL